MPSRVGRIVVVVATGKMPGTIILAQRGIIYRGSAQGSVDGRNSAGKIT